MKALSILCLSAALLAAPATFALSPAGEQDLAQLQTRWAEINYQLPEAQRAAAFEKLAGQADAALQREPQAAELHVWRGIILSTWAGAKGGLGALGLAKDAKASLEQSLELDPQALDGSAYTSLATLYAQVPGWPIGFGDDDKAGAVFRQALAINPGGLDPNYFYAGYLMDHNRYAEARDALQRALAAPDRPGRAIADAGRRAEAQRLLEQANAKLK